MTQENDLQNDVATESNEVEEAQHENHDQQHGGDSETPSEPQHEENGEGAEAKPINQESVNDAIAKQHAKYREEQRRREAAEQELFELRNSQGSNGDPEPKIVEVDQYADDLEDQLKQRDESIRSHQSWQMRQQQRQQHQQHRQQQSAAEQQQRSQDSSERFLKSAADAKIDQKEIVQAVQNIGQYQLGNEVASYLMNDDKGVHMTLALSKNPALLVELGSMQPHEKILYIERNVRSKINATPRQSKGKTPPTRVKGRAADASDRYPLTGGKVTIK